MSDLRLNPDYTPPTHGLPTAYTPPTQSVALPDRLTEQVAEAIRASKRPNTLRAYKSDLAAFSDWCATHEQSALPAAAETVAAYLADQAQRLKVSSLRRHLATISKAHELAGYRHERNPAKSGLVRDTVAGLRNTYGMEPERAPALTAEQLKAITDAISTTQPAEYGRAERPDLVGLRDRALLLVGWCAALRRSELAQLTWGQVEWQPTGAVLHLRGSKTDKTGAGQLAPLAAEPGSAYCPVAALRAWQQASEQRGYWRAGGGSWQSAVADSQPVFRAVNRHGHLSGDGLSGHTVGLIVAQRGAAVGLHGLSGHSLRRGLVQAATLAGKSDSAIIQTTRWRNPGQIRAYQGDAGLLERAASRGLLSR